MPTTTSDSPCWKKNMYQLFLSWRYCMKPAPTAPDGRHRHGDDAPPAIRLVVGRGVGGHRAPVVADDHRVAVAAERLVERAGVEAEHAGLVAPVGGHRGRRVAAHPRRHRAEAGARPARAAGSGRSTPSRGSRGGRAPAARRPPRGTRTRRRWRPRDLRWATSTGETSVTRPAPGEQAPVTYRTLQQGGIRCSTSASSASGDPPRARATPTAATAATRPAWRWSRPGTSRSSSTSAPGCASGARPSTPPSPSVGSALVTHIHWDHVQGLPFFTPGAQARRPLRRVRPAAGRRTAASATRSASSCGRRSSRSPPRSCSATSASTTCGTPTSSSTAPR